MLIVLKDKLLGVVSGKVNLWSHANDVKMWGLMCYFVMRVLVTSFGVLGGF